MTAVSCRSVCLTAPLCRLPFGRVPQPRAPWVFHFHTLGCIPFFAPLAGPLSDAGELLKEAVGLVLQVRRIALGSMCP